MFRKSLKIGISQNGGKVPNFWKKDHKGTIRNLRYFSFLLLLFISGCSKSIEHKSIYVISFLDNLQRIEEECRKWNDHGFLYLVFTYPYLDNEMPEILLSADCITRDNKDRYYEINLTSDKIINSYMGNISMLPVINDDQRINIKNVYIDSTEALDVFLDDIEVSRFIYDLDYQIFIRMSLENEPAIQGYPLVWHLYLTDFLHSPGIHRYLTMDGEMIFIDR
jgi:hypothetical protein